MKTIHRDQYELDDHGPTIIKRWVGRRGCSCCKCDGCRHLVPYRWIHNFLLSQNGKLWSEVHSHLSKKFPRRSRTGWAVWAHINREVDDRCFVWDGKVWGTGYFWRYDFFVHPETGILYTQRLPKRRYPSTPSGKEPEIKVDNERQLFCKEGIWYLRTTTQVPKVQVFKDTIYGPDTITVSGYPKRPISYILLPYQSAFRVRRRDYMAGEVSVKQLNRAELRKWSVRNIPTYEKPSRREVARRNRQ